MEDEMKHEDWKMHMRIGIMSSTIALMVREHFKAGKGAPSPEDMERFKEEAGAVAELWEEGTAP